MTHAVVIGAGPAGLMAAEVMAQAGLQVTICEAKPSVGRKFLMAGKSGLNLTKSEAATAFSEAFAEARGPLAPMLDTFDAQAVQAWARELGQEVFTGSTGRVFPVAMKASPLLRAWLGRLGALGVQVNTRWHWQGWDADALLFETPQGPQMVRPDVTVLALGGASWARLGSTGEWAEVLQARGIGVAPFAAANAGIAVDWSVHMKKHFGTPLKGVAWSAGPYASRGEATLSARGLEGGGIYSVSRGVREGHSLHLDLLPDLSVPEVTARLSKPRGKASLNNHLRKVLGLPPQQIALLQEMARPLPDGLRALARLIKAVPIAHTGLRPMDEAISTAGGIPFSALNDGLMLRDMPGVFAAGEMLDWEAPTGGYLITACLATGRWAGLNAAQWAATTPAPAPP
ncbi:TIGR03862 family flavoprotein [Sulfitobacter sp. JB4-11]|uniref:TIGR03862 family flavoprotein n=1 Tax=Sulfitobacter rhodophyticola TaxID=3238304 RepID=UPI003D8180F3